MVYPFSQPSLRAHFNEIVIANFGSFQIAVLTTTRLVQQKIFSASEPEPERIYQDCGWLIYNGQLTANVDGLVVGATAAGPFKSVNRVAPSVPISFEVQSSHTLPTPVANAAIFACLIEGAAFPYHTVFRSMLPHFARVYPFKQKMTILSHVHQFLNDEANFIDQNYNQLKKIPFFRARLGL